MTQSTKQVAEFLVSSIIILESSLALGAEKDSWLCTEEASQRRGSNIESCGVGVGQNEQEAREDAFTGAEHEFNRICRSSADCNSNKVIITPRRTSCEQKPDGLFVCHRLLEYAMITSAPGSPAAPFKFKAFNLNPIFLTDASVN